MDPGRAPSVLGRQANSSPAYSPAGARGFLPRKPALAAAQPSHAIQRRVAWKANNHPDNTLDGFANTLNGLVLDAATSAFDDATTLPDVDGYTRLWGDTANIIAGVDPNTLEGDDLQEYRSARRFSNARYGYAVESLACSNHDALQTALPDGYTYQLQAGRGMTRPDIVVRDDDDDEVAWFDITSENSINHIDRKTHSGWRNKPYVAEILYPTMTNIDTLAQGNTNIAARVVRRNAFRRRRESWRSDVSSFSTRFEYKWMQADMDGTARGARLPKAREILEEILEYMPTPQQAKSILRCLNVRLADVGVTSGGSQSEGEKLLHEYFDNLGL